MLEEENTYFRNVIKDALKDLRKKGVAYIFTEEQAKMLKKVCKKELTIEIEDGIYKVTMKKNKEKDL